MDENWDILTTLFPRDWRETGRTCGALGRLRGFRSEEALMRTLLLHVSQGYSLRETTATARAAGLADVSDVALLKRFKSAGPWFRELNLQLLADVRINIPQSLKTNMILVDATHVKEQGKTGSCWRIHYALNFPSLSCSHFSISPNSGKGVAESFQHFPVKENDCMVGDRGYSKPAGIAHVSDHKGYVLVRYNPFQLALKTINGQRFNLDKALAQWPEKQQTKSWRCAVAHPDGGIIPGRLIAVRRSHAATQTEIKKALRSASKKQYTIKRPVLEYAKYIMIFTTLPEDQFDKEFCLEWYRLRWQIELLFKRLKSLAGLGHLPKRDAESSQAWLHGKLFTRLLTEKLIRYGETVSPWGYDMERQAEN